MRLDYKPTENQIKRNFKFRETAQFWNKTFSAFCNLVKTAGKTCTFCDWIAALLLKTGEPGRILHFAESCQPILDGNKANELQIISTDKEDTSVFSPVEMINADGLNGDFAFETVSIIQQYPNNFKGLGKMKDYKVKLCPCKKNMCHFPREHFFITSMLGLLII